MLSVTTIMQVTGAPRLPGRCPPVPPIEVHLIASEEHPGGIGETGANAGPPSLCNALYAATGIRLRRLPIDRDVLAGKKPA